MSGGSACKCAESKKPARARNWGVVQFMCNYSAFNGYHYTPSDYSCIQCNACGALWRTKAGYVSLLPRAQL